MRPRAIATAVAISIAVLAAAVQPSVEADAPPTLMLRLSGTSSMAHACPIGPRLALTSLHVVDQRSAYAFGAASRPLAMLAYDDGLGAEGVLRAVAAYAWRDLAELEPHEGEFPRWYRVAQERPKVGDRVWLIGYDWRDRKRAAAERRWDGRVTRIVALQVWIDTGGDPGSSGSCVVNAAGEVVAVNGGYWKENPSDSDKAGIAVGVWGRWLDYTKEKARE